MRTLILTSCLLLALSAAAQMPDAHFLAPRTKVIAQRSVFAHGYLHGYEEGFHQGDLDLQMAHTYRNMDHAKEADKSTGYRREFGERSYYDQGYRQGYRVGYGDGVSDRNFRAIDGVQRLVDSAAQPVSGEIAQPGKPSREFDSGFAAGYFAGQQQGLADARGSRPSTPSEPTCPMDTMHKAEYCGAYAKAYGMGYADGYVNQAHTAVVQAAK